jgi:hypothetical protein
VKIRKRPKEIVASRKLLLVVVLMIGTMLDRRGLIYSFAIRAIIED